MLKNKFFFASNSYFQNLSLRFMYVVWKQLNKDKASLTRTMYNSNYKFILPELKVAVNARYVPVFISPSLLLIGQILRNLGRQKIHSPCRLFFRRQRIQLRHQRNHRRWSLSFPPVTWVRALDRNIGTGSGRHSLSSRLLLLVNMTNFILKTLRKCFCFLAQQFKFSVVQLLLLLHLYIKLSIIQAQHQFGLKNLSNVKEHSQQMSTMYKHH